MTIEYSLCIVGFVDMGSHLDHRDLVENCLEDWRWNLHSNLMTTVIVDAGNAV